MNTQQHLTEEQIAQCVDAMSEGTYDLLPAAFREHVAHCDLCSSEILMVSEIMEEAMHENLTVKKKTSKLKILKPVLYSAATLTILFSVYLFVKLNQEPLSIPIAENVEINKNNPDSVVQFEPKKEEVLTEKKNEKESKRTTTSELKQKDLLAYTPNTQLEKVVENFRGTYRGNDIKVLTPESIIYPATDSLKWSNPSSGTLIVEIWNNQEVKVFDKETNEQGIAIPMLSNGLYYWKLMNEEFDLLYAGKIKVE